MIDQLPKVLNNIIYQYFEPIDWDAIRFFRPDMLVEIKDKKFHSEHKDCPELPKYQISYDRRSMVEFAWEDHKICYYNAVVYYKSPEVKLVHYLYGNIVIEVRKDSIELYTSDEFRPEIPHIIPRELLQMASAQLNNDAYGFVAERCGWDYKSDPTRMMEGYVNTYPDFRDLSGRRRQEYKQYHKRGFIDLFNLSDTYFIENHSHRHIFDDRSTSNLDDNWSLSIG